MKICATCGKQGKSMSKVPGLGNVCSSCNIPAGDNAFGVLDNLEILEVKDVSVETITDHATELANDGLTIPEIKTAIKSRYNRECNPNILASARKIVKERNDAAREARIAKKEVEQSAPKEEPKVEEPAVTEEVVPTTDGLDVDDVAVLGNNQMAPQPFPGAIQEDDFPELPDGPLPVEEIEDDLAKHEAVRISCDTTEIRKDDVYVPITDVDEPSVEDRINAPGYYNGLRNKAGEMQRNGYMRDAAVLKIWQEEERYHPDANKFLSELEAIL